MALYDLTISRIHIGEIRSRNFDTLYASTALHVLNANGSLHNDYGGGQTVDLEDHKAGGDIVPTQSFTSVDVPPPTSDNPDGGSINWVFFLVNQSGAASGWIPVANKAADAFAGAVAGKLLESTSVMATVLLALAELGILAAQEALNMLTADCDGQVAAGAFSLTAAQLLGMASPAKAFDQIQNNPGSSSPAGCGANSSYDIEYTIARRFTPTNSLKTAMSNLGYSPAAGLSVIRPPVRSARELMGR